MIYARAKDNGTEKLSSILKNWYASTKVQTNIEAMAGNNFISRNIIIKIDDKKKAMLPSRDLLKKYTFPYFLPIIEAIESDILIINKDEIAILFGNKNIIKHEEIKTYEAPVKLLDSKSLVIVPKYLL